MSCTISLLLRWNLTERRRNRARKAQTVIWLNVLTFRYRHHRAHLWRESSICPRNIFICFPSIRSCCVRREGEKKLWHIHTHGRKSPKTFIANRWMMKNFRSGLNLSNGWHHSSLSFCHRFLLVRLFNSVVFNFSLYALWGELWTERKVFSRSHDACLIRWK